MIKIRRGDAPARLLEIRLEWLSDIWGAFGTGDGRSEYGYGGRGMVEAMLEELDLGEELATLTHGKCAYCEKPLEGNRAEIGHIRPRNNTINFGGEHFPLHYFWLVFEWSNLLPVCVACNQSRGNRFPLVDESDRVRVPPDPSFDVEAMEAAVAAESALLVDPTRDDPERHFGYVDSGEVMPRTEQGEVTIELLNLNRSELIEGRLRALSDLDAAGIRNPGAVSDDLPFAAFCRERLDAQPLASASMAEESAVPQQGPQESAASVDEARAGADEASEHSDGDALAASVRGTPKEKPNPDRSGPKPTDKTTVDRSAGAPSYSTDLQDYYRQSRKIEKVVLRDFRSIEDLTLHMAPGDADRAGWTVLLGENGTGKSTVLHGIALALAGGSYRSQLQEERDLDASAFVRRCNDEPAPESGSVEVYLSGVPEPIRLGVESDSRRFLGPEKAPVLLLGYGSTRLLPRRGNVAPTGSDLARVDNLFDPFVALGDARRFLLELSPKDFEPVGAAFAALLNLGVRVRMTQNLDAGRIDVHLFDTVVPLEQLSDGYQSVIALAADIMSILRERWGSMAVAEGVVLLDELGAHLHPKWRMGIVKSLRQTFPRVQFIVTTHDPLCLRGLRAGEVIVMRRDPNRKVVAWADLPPTEGLRVDQLLTSEHFGLQTTLDATVERDFERYYELLAAGKLGEEQKKDLASLEKRFGQRRLLGDTRRERLMLSAIDRFLAKEPALGTDKERAAAEDVLELELEATLNALEI